MKIADVNFATDEKYLKAMNEGLGFVVFVPSQTDATLEYMVRVDQREATMCSCKGFFYRLKCIHHTLVTIRLNKAKGLEPIPARDILGIAPDWTGDKTTAEHIANAY